jgi:aspartate aminotransferase
MFPRVRGLLDASGLTTEGLVEALLYKYGVLVLPGTSFPERAGEGHVRISFATSRDKLVEGARLIVEAAKRIASR